LSKVWTTANNEPGTSYEHNAYIQYRQVAQYLSRHKSTLCNPIDVLVAPKERVQCISLPLNFIILTFYCHAYFTQK
jgi:hypothetical protein